MAAHTHTPIEVAFVDKIDAAPTVRLSLTNAPWKVGRGLDLSPPPLRRGVSSSMLTDGARYPAAAFDNRTIGLPLTLRSDNAPAALTAMADLARELNRPTNVLRIKIGSTYVFYRTFRAPDYILSQVLGMYQVDFFDVRLPAEPFGYTTRVDLGPYTINNDPAHATNPQRIILPSITGDVDTPAYVWTTTNISTASESVTPMIAIGRGPTTGSFQGSRLVQAEAMTLGTDTTLPGADATMSPGSGSSYARTSFATDASMVTRLSVGAADLAPGRYTVLARVRRSVSGDVVKMRYGQNYDVPGGATVYQPTVTLPTGTGSAIVRLGVIQTPAGGSMRENGYSGTVLPGPESFLLQAQRVSGTGNLDIDYLLFVPADHATLTATLPGYGISPPEMVAWDGVGEALRRMSSVTDPFVVTNTEDSVVIGVSGKFPTLLPAGENVLHFLRNIDRGTGTLADSITATAALNVSYWPRYLVTP